MYGLLRATDAMGFAMVEYNKYSAKCVAEGRKPVDFLTFMTSSIKGTLEY